MFFYSARLAISYLFDSRLHKLPVWQHHWFKYIKNFFHTRFLPLQSCVTCQQLSQHLSSFRFQVIALKRIWNWNVSQLSMWLAHEKVSGIIEIELPLGLGPLRWCCWTGQSAVTCNLRVRHQHETRCWQSVGKCHCVTTAMSVIHYKHCCFLDLLLSIHKCTHLCICQSIYPPFIWINL